MALVQTAKRARQELPMLLYNPRTKAVHDPDCRWISGAANGRKPLDLNTFRWLPEEGRFPVGAHRVTCCAPNVPTTVLPLGTIRKRS
jgi:hypothetical protein